MKCFAPYYFDVDQTLVLCRLGKHSDAVIVNEGRFHEAVVPNGPVIDDLMWLSRRGHTIIVWSKEGADWAEAVVKALGLDAYVALCLEKPTGYYDDLEAPEFMGKRHYAVREDASTGGAR